MWDEPLDSLVFENLDVGLTKICCLLDCDNIPMRMSIVPFMSTSLTVGILHEEMERLLQGESGSDSYIYA